MKTRTVLFAAALAAFATPAMASPDTSIGVALGDLDLSSAKDRAKLDRRIETAARMVSDSGARDLASLKGERACIDRAIAEASAKAKVAMADARNVRLAATDPNPGA